MVTQEPHSKVQNPGFAIPRGFCALPWLWFMLSNAHSEDHSLFSQPQPSTETSTFGISAFCFEGSPFLWLLDPRKPACLSFCFIRLTFGNVAEGSPFVVESWKQPFHEFVSTSLGAATRQRSARRDPPLAQEEDVEGCRFWCRVSEPCRWLRIVLPT